MTVWTIHGIVNHVDSLRFTHRNMLDAGHFQRFLEERSAKFVDLDQAVEGRGDALTIDDSTSAAADAAELCRTVGHEVTIFLNGRNIALQQTYWFVLLNVLVERCERDSIHLNGEAFPLNSHLDRQRFRKAAKRATLSLHTEEEREAFILRLSLSVGIDSLAVPEHLATLTPDRTRHLKAVGARIENHGWTHGNVAAMPRQDIIADIQRGADWLQEEVGIVTRHYAVPFGSAKPPESLAISLYEIWHLVDEDLPEGRIDARLVNRTMLSEDALRTGITRC